MAKLLVSFPAGSETPFDLTEETVTIGRLPDNSLQLDDGSVSSHHAELIPTEGGGFFLRDLESTNGTRVNGENVTEAHLSDKDVIRFGGIEVKFFSEVAEEAMPMPQVLEIENRPAASSVRPSDFSNASPFKSKGKKKAEPAANAAWGVAALAILSFVAALGLVMTLKP